MSDDRWIEQIASLHVDAEERGRELVRLFHENLDLKIENAKLREVVTAVADGEMRHAEIVDKWVLLFDNPTLSYGQTILGKARAPLKAQQDELPTTLDQDATFW